MFEALPACVSYSSRVVIWNKDAGVPHFVDCGAKSCLEAVSLSGLCLCQFVVSTEKVPVVTVNL